MSKCISWLENLEEFSLLLQLIAEPHRLKILCLLTERHENALWGICVSEIVNQFQEPQNLISHHLSMLKRAQLVVTKREGKHIKYSINSTVYDKFKDSLKTIFHFK